MSQEKMKYSSNDSCADNRHHLIMSEYGIFINAFCITGQQRICIWLGAVRWQAIQWNWRKCNTDFHSWLQWRDVQTIVSRYLSQRVIASNVHAPPLVVDPGSENGGFAHNHALSMWSEHTQCFSGYRAALSASYEYQWNPSRSATAPVLKFKSTWAWTRMRQFLWTS